MTNSNLEALLNSIPCSGAGVPPKVKMSDKEYDIYTQYKKETIEAVQARVGNTLVGRFLSGKWW